MKKLKSGLKKCLNNIMENENKNKELDALKNEFATKILKEVIPECTNLVRTKGFDATIIYAVNQGISFAINCLKKYI